MKLGVDKWRNRIPAEKVTDSSVIFTLPLSNTARQRQGLAFT
jgi:hypothetical protein